MGYKRGAFTLVERGEKMKRELLIVLLAGFAYAVVSSPATIAGLVLILSVFVFGGASLLWKEPEIRLLALAFMLLLAVLNIAVHSINFGIDFSGGTRIPIILERPVDQQTMAQLVNAIKSRASAFGLVQTKVRAIGNERIYVEIASTDRDTIDNIKSTLSKQGVFKAVVDGKEALSGDNIFKQSIRPATPQEVGGADWGVSFSVDKEGGAKFARAAFGKANYPIYLFLDRPEIDVLIISNSTLARTLPPGATFNEGLGAIRDALKLEGKEVEVVVAEDVGNLSYSGNILIDSAAELTMENATYAEMTPEFVRLPNGLLIVNRFEAIGLLSAPTLSPQITSGVPTYSFTITGSVSSVNPSERAEEARERVREVESILKGGAFPVKINLGSETSVPPTLGSKFLEMSVVALGLALLSIAVFIALRYHDLKLIGLILAISLAELLILVAILGSFTIDLAAMAGIIAAVGTGVDAQIVITDEIKKRREEGVRLAFDIIKTNATVASLTMLPLMFSGLVEVIGFAESAILGAILGYTLTRPAFAVLLSKGNVFKHKNT